MKDLKNDASWENCRLCQDLLWPILHQLCSMKPPAAYNLVWRNLFK